MVQSRKNRNEMRRLNNLNKDSSPSYRRLGSIADIGDMLTVDQTRWLFANTPTDASVAETIAGIIIDAFNEEEEHAQRKTNRQGAK